MTHYLEWNELNGIIFDSLYYFFPVSQEFIVHNLRVYTQPIQGMHAFSFLLLFWGVSAFFFSLEAGLDSAYRVSEPRRLSVSQFLGSVMVVLFGLVALICISFLRVVRMITQDVLELEPELSSSIEVANYLTISLCLTLLLFFMVFRHLPNRRVEARAILPEVVFSALLWMAGNLIFRFLAPSWSLQKIYGPFFVSVTLLLWAYAFGCILLGSARLSKDGFFGDWASETQPLEIPPPIVSNGLDVKVEAPEDEELPFP